MGMGLRGIRIRGLTSDGGGVHGEEEDGDGVDRTDHLAGGGRCGDCAGRLRHFVHGYGFQARASASTLRGDRDRGVACHEKQRGEKWEQARTRAFEGLRGGVGLFGATEI
jgi:hypothetical protein